MYALFKVPFLIKTIFHLKLGVESYITNGANLMWPGVERIECSLLNSDNQESNENEEEKNDKKAFKKMNKFQIKQYESLRNEVVAVFCKKVLVDSIIEVPIAVGRRVSETNGKVPHPSELKLESKGVAVEIVHYFLDELWNSGSKQAITPQECIDRSNRDQDDEVKDEEDEEIMETKDETAIENEGENNEIEQDHQNESKEPEDNNEIAEDKDVPEHAEDIVEAEKVQSENEDEEEKTDNDILPDLMDEIILRNFVMCIVRHIKDDKLPLEPSILQSDYMYKYEHKELGKIDFKKSNYKKITKFLKKMKQLKFINFGKVKGIVNFSKFILTI